MICRYLEDTQVSLDSVVNSVLSIRAVNVPSPGTWFMSSFNISLHAFHSHRFLLDESRQRNALKRLEKGCHEYQPPIDGR